MNVTISNRIFIEDPSDEVIEWTKANLKMANPEYEKKQRMGFWTGRTPRELRLYEWNGNVLILPFGVCREIMPMVRGAALYTRFKQDTVIDYGGKDMGLYDYQEEAVRKMMEAKYGILKATTGAGKSQMGIGLIKSIRRRALWLCHTADLLVQSKERAERYIDQSLIGTITEGKVNVGTGVTFATVQTMANLELTQYRDYWDVIVIDEAHHVSSSADSFTRYEKVLNHLAARRKIGLTATPERSDGLIRATFALIGKVMWEVPEEAVADRVTGVKIRTVDTDADITDECLNDDGTINYVKLITHLTEDKDRNDLIADKIIENRGHSCLILSERLDHLTAIMMRLPEDIIEQSVYIDGKMNSKAGKERRKQALEDMRTGKKNYLFSSLSLAREGLDIPRLDRLFLACPAKFSAVITQAVGRVRRVYPGKELPIVYDFRDINIGYCARAYKERLKSYRKVGAIIEKPSYEPHKDP